MTKRVIGSQDSPGNFSSHSPAQSLNLLLTNKGIICQGGPGQAKFDRLEHYIEVNTLENFVCSLLTNSLGPYSHSVHGWIPWSHQSWTHFVLRSNIFLPSYQHLKDRASSFCSLLQGTECVFFEQQLSMFLLVRRSTFLKLCGGAVSTANIHTCFMRTRLACF